MSILIKGMEMPNRCFECIFLTTVPNFFCLAGKRDLCAEHGINISRPDWCPLIELPPHGRLIDADKFKADYSMKNDCAECEKELQGSSRACEYDRIYSKMDFCQWIDNAETVIEAEGET